MGVKSGRDRELRLRSQITERAGGLRARSRPLTLVEAGRRDDGADMKDFKLTVY